VSHVTVTVNAVDPEIGEKVYAWVRDGIHPLRGREAATLLLNRQIEGIRLLKEHGVVVKINTILIPGVNEGHIEAVAEKMSELGVDILNCIPLMPVAGSVWEGLTEPSPELLNRERAAAGRFLPQMRHCTRCRADALGLLGGDPELGIQLVKEYSKKPLNPAEDRPYVAVASLEGVLVNQHLGEASHLWIFGQEGGEFRHLDSREVPEPGQGENRWVQLAAQLRDCHTVLVSRAGEMPRNTLVRHGVKVVETEGMILSVLQDLYSGKAVAPMRRERSLCGTECGGNGFGCA
jgi:nitrogen fixation protein NifB